MKIDLSPLLSGETDTIPFDYPLTIEEEFYGVTFPKPARVLGTITNRAGYIAMKATVEVSYTALCDRCLSPTEKSLTLPFEKPVAMRNTLENQDEDQDEYMIVQGRYLDTAEPLREAIVLSFPTKHLCREDCKGLCPRCGKDLNEGPCQCGKKEIDPRMAQFASLLGKNKEKNP